MKPFNLTRLNNPVTHSQKSCMDITGMTGSWSQGPGFVSKQMETYNIVKTDNK